MLNKLPQIRLKLLEKEQYKNEKKQLMSTKVSKNSQQNNSETVANENDKEIPKQRYISPEKDKKLLMI